jgi:hypothetical protein
MLASTTYLEWLKHVPVLISDLDAGVAVEYGEEVGVQAGIDTGKKMFYQN